MSSNYTGNGASTQAPGPTPSPGAAPIVVLPSDGDALAASSVAQAFKECADFIAYLTPLGRLLSRQRWLSVAEANWVPADYTLSNTAALVRATSTGVTSINFPVPIDTGSSLVSVAVKVNKASTGAGGVFLHKVSNLSGASTPTEAVIASTPSSASGHQTITVTFSVSPAATELLFIEYQAGNTGDIVYGASVSFST